MASLTLKVQGMSCEHCVSSVKGALEKVEGVKSARVELTPGRAVVEYDEARTTPNALVGAVMDEGYEAEEAA